MALINGLRFDQLRGDIYGGITSAIIALPLALAFGVASGAGPMAGVYGSICLGFFAAMFGGAPSQISGPTGPMAVVMTGVIMQFAHNPTVAFTVVMMAGVMQIIFGLLKFGKYVALMPFPVISGFMSGIGCILIILQLTRLLGHTPPMDGPLYALLALPDAVAHVNIHALIAGMLTVGVMIFTPKAIAKHIPTPLIALLVGSFAVYYFLPHAPVLGAVPMGLPEIHIPTIDWPLIRKMFSGAFVLALVGSIDSLLTATVADSMVRAKHRSNRELIGQGIGNIVTGLFGGVAGCGAAMRTVVNVTTGGRTPISGMLHAVLLLLIMLGAGKWVGNIPHAVLAGILIHIGAHIIDWDYIKRWRTAPKDGIIFMVLVLGITVFFNLIAAVVIGMVLSSLVLVKHLADIQLEQLHLETDPDAMPSRVNDAERELLASAHGRIALFLLSGPVSFGAARGMVDIVSDTASDSYDAMILDLHDVTLLDSTSALALEDIIRHIHEDHKTLYICGLSSSIISTLERMHVLQMLEDDHIVTTRFDAITAAVKLIKTIDA